MIGATKSFITSQVKAGNWFIIITMRIGVGELHKEKPRVACRKLLNFHVK